MAYLQRIGITSAGGRPHRPRSSQPEESRLQKKIEIAGQSVIALLDPRVAYRLLGHDGKLIRMADSRYAQVLIARRLIVGILNGANELSSLKLAAGKTAAQVRNVMKLKPPATSICNKATVVKVLPNTYTHRSSLAKRL